MFKNLIKLFLENRLNNISESIEKISEQMIEDEDSATAKGKIAQATFQINENITREVRKIKTKVEIYNLIFKEIKL